MQGARRRETIVQKSNRQPHRTLAAGAGRNATPSLAGGADATAAERRLRAGGAGSRQLGRQDEMSEGHQTDPMADAGRWLLRPGAGPDQDATARLREPPARAGAGPLSHISQRTASPRRP